MTWILGRLWRLPASKSFEVVRGRHFHDAGAEFGIGQIVENDGNLAIHQRQLHGLAVQVEVARVLGVDGDGGIAEHGLGPRGGDGQVAAGHAVHGIADVPEVALRRPRASTSRSEMRGVAVAGTS